MIPPAPTSPDGVLEHLAPDGDVIVPLANGEPVAVLDAIEASAGRFDQLRIHQMHALHDRPSLHGAFGGRIRQLPLIGGGAGQALRPYRPAGAMATLEPMDRVVVGLASVDDGPDGRPARDVGLR